MNRKAAPTRPQADLRSRLKAAQRRKQWTAFLLTLPVLVLLLTVFVIPIGSTLIFATTSTEVRSQMPNVYRELQGWDGHDLPQEAVYAALAYDLKTGYATKSIAGVATRLNHEISGFRSLVMRSARKADDLQAPFKEALIEVNKRWGDVEYWRSLKMASRTVTPRYLLQAIELEETWDGGIVRVSEAKAVFLDFLVRTFSIAFWVTVLCIVLGYPLAYFIAHARPAIARIAFAAVLLPFAISVLVRMAAWMTALQKEGIVNSFLLQIGLISEPLQMVFNRFGLYSAMVHVLLPFMVLPIYSAMKDIPPLRVKAATSLGAPPHRAFLEVYVPDTLPGLSAGCLLVFIISLGYYITPALIGGPDDQMLSTLITVFALETGNWGMASAVSLLLLVSTVIAYLLFNRLLGAKAFDV